MNLTFHKYHLPFSSSLITSSTTFTHRQGFILQYNYGNDISFFGEAAPLPGFSTEHIDDVLQEITMHKNDLQDILTSKIPIALFEQFYDNRMISPSLQFALDSIAYQLEAYYSGQSLHTFLFNNATKSMPINAVISLRDNEFLKETSRFISKGFKTIKCKIGLDFDTEYANLQTLRKQFPDLRIRLDTNQAWSADQAANYLTKLQALNIEYCEEPLRDPNPDKYQKLKNQIRIPLALDETICGRSDWQAFLPFISVIVLKPMVLGSFTKNFVTKRLADTLDCSVVITTSLESGIGRMITSILATGLGSLTMAQGLNTSQFLAQDVFDDTANIANGMYHLRSSQKRIDINQRRLLDLSTQI